MGSDGEATSAGDGDSEGSPSRLDRELQELLQELRVVLPGVEVLLAFLLGVAFTAEFDAAGDSQRAIYFVAFASSALSTLLLLVPSVWHRIRWRKRDKEAILRSSNRCAIAGTVGLAVAVIAVVLLITLRTYGWTPAVVVASLASAALLALWYLVPMARSQQDGKA